VIGLPLVRRWYVVEVDASGLSEAASSLRRFIIARGTKGSVLSPEGVGGAGLGGEAPSSVVH
jgi:hypothetical protein